MGKVDRALLVQLVGTAAAVVVPSVYEGYGLQVQEAIAAGVPAVATGVHPCPKSQLGAILVGNKPEALADGIRRALERVTPELLAGTTRGPRWFVGCKPAPKRTSTAPAAETSLRTADSRGLPSRLRQH